MSEWRRYTVEELADHRAHALATGPFGSAISARFFQDSGVPVIRGNNLSLDVGTRLIEQDLAFLPDSKAAEFSRSEVRRGDLVFTCWGTVGQIGLIDERARSDRYIISNKQMKVTPNPKIADPLFLYYALSSPRAVASIINSSIGSSVPGFNLSQLREMEVLVPPLTEQRAIAGILGALDDKIASNNSIAAAILGIADCFFRERKANASEWPTVRFVDIADVFGGGTPRTSETSYWNGEIAWVTPTDVTRLSAPYLFDSAKHITELGLANCASQLYPAGSIFMTSRATIGSFAVVQRPAAANQGFIVVVPRHGVERWWLFHEMRFRTDEMIGLANGSTFLEISRKNFRAMNLQMPPRSLLDRFHELAAPLHRRARAAERENRVLAELRDYLLPKLISGQLRIKDAERAVEEVV